MALVIGFPGELPRVERAFSRIEPNNEPLPFFTGIDRPGKLLYRIVIGICQPSLFRILPFGSAIFRSEAKFSTPE